MTVFTRLVESKVHAFQFVEIPLDEVDEDSSESYKTHLQHDAQREALNQAELPVTIFDILIRPVSDSPEKKYLAMKVSSADALRSREYHLHQRDWFVVEPLVGGYTGEVMTNESFQEKYGNSFKLVG